MKDHRQGRTAAGEHALKRAHVRRLLMTLADICTTLARAQPDPMGKTACLVVKRQLIRLADQPDQTKQGRLNPRKT